MEEHAAPDAQSPESHGADTILTTPQDPQRLAWVEHLALASIRENASAIEGLNQ